MLIIKSKEWSDIYNELQGSLKSQISLFANSKGIKLEFISDSKTIQKAIESIANRVADLSETTKKEENKND